MDSSERKAEVSDRDSVDAVSLKNEAVILS